MNERQAVVNYLRGAESLRRRELVWGMVRDPAAPLWPHQSPGTRQRHRTWKRRWCLEYGVCEYWLVDPVTRTMTVFGFGDGGRVRRHTFRGPARVRSAVLPSFDLPVSKFFRSSRQQTHLLR